MVRRHVVLQKGRAGLVVVLVVGRAVVFFL
jgi:hypothetical protein